MNDLNEILIRKKTELALKRLRIFDLILRKKNNKYLLHFINIFQILLIKIMKISFLKIFEAINK